MLNFVQCGRVLPDMGNELYIITGVVLLWFYLYYLLVVYKTFSAHDLFCTKYINI